MHNNSVYAVASSNRHTIVQLAPLSSSSSRQRKRVCKQQDRGQQKEQAKEPTEAKEKGPESSRKRRKQKGQKRPNSGSADPRIRQQHQELDERENKKGGDWG